MFLKILFLRIIFYVLKLFKMLCFFFPLVNWWWLYVLFLESFRLVDPKNPCTNEIKFHLVHWTLDTELRFSFNC